MMLEESESEPRLVQAIAVVDIDPSMTLFRPNQQKWVSSLELLSEIPKEPRPNSKVITLAPSAHLLVGFCQKNRPPIYEIDFVTHPGHEWISLRSGNVFGEKHQVTLCYKAGDNLQCQPLADIQLLITERKRHNEEKEVFILPPGYKIVNNNPILHSYLIYKRMRSPLEQTFKAVLLEQYPENEDLPALSMLPLFCFPEGIHLSKQLKGFVTFNFILTSQAGDRIYCNCLTFRESLQDSLKQELGLLPNDRIYFEKAICLISRHRYTDEFAECLKHLYRLSMSKNDVPFHHVISSFVEGLVLPKELGINGMSYSYGGSNITFDTNPSYPIISERSIYCVFKFLPLQAIISIFQGILLEKKIIFVSHSKTVLGYAVEAFLGFLFPFRWEHVIIPVLPSTLKEYITAPVPIIVGISPSMLDRNVESDVFVCVTQSLIVQMDNGTVLNDEDLPPLPQKLEKQLRRKLQPFELYDEEDVREFLQNQQSTYIFKMQEVEHPQFQGHIIRDCFYEFLLTLMKNYKKFWKTQKYKEKENSSMGLTEPQLVGDMFKLQDFLSDLGMTKVGSFGYKLTQGTIFTSFLQRRYQNQNNPELLFFDESIDKKKSKKDLRLLQKPSNIRYIVAKHPQPEKVKAIYSYDSFPSILGKELPIKETEINLMVDSINEEEMQFLQQFLQSQFKLNRKMFSQSYASDVDYKIESLLLQKYRVKYQESFQNTMGASRVDTLRSSLVSKHRNSRQNFNKLEYFYKLYLEQNSFIEDLFQNWPFEEEKKIREISKKDYIRLQMKGEYEEDELVSIFDSCGGKEKHYESLQLGNTKLVFLEEQNYKSSMISLDSLRNSKKKIKFAYQIYFDHFKVRSFVNRILQVQPRSFFSYALELIKENRFTWNMETLLLFRQYITSQ